jgi:xylose isomerase domain protein TIM barrel
MNSKESMKLAISNIAFGKDQQAALKCVSQSGVEGLVVAPTIIWPSLPEIANLSGQELKDRLGTLKWKAGEYRKKLGDFGLACVGLQSLTYGVGENAKIFGTEEEGKNLAEHLKRLTDLAGSLGADSMSFGSPGLRNPGELSGEQAVEMVAKLFGRVAVAAHDNNTQIAIEPLSGYGNKFVESLEQARKLTDRINHPGFGIHPDTAAMHGAGDMPEDLASLIRDHRDSVRGIDASAPDLARLSSALDIPQGKYVDALRSVSYQGWLSLEVRGPLSPDVIEKEIKYIKERCGLAA